MTVMPSVLASASLGVRLLVKCGKTLALILWDAALAFFNEEALIRAGSLAFTTLLSLVPLLTMALRFMHFYGVSAETQASLEATLAQYFLPSQSKDMVALLGQTSASVTENITRIGFLSFCVTLILLAREVEGHILKICNQTTSWRTSLLHYGAFLIGAPLGIALALLLLQPFQLLMDQAPAGLGRFNYPFLFSGFVVMALLRSFSGYTLSYAASALGATFATLTAWGAWQVCVWYFGHSASLSAYGALACIPAFFLWVFVVWSCVLFGAQVAAKAHRVWGCTSSKLAIPNK